METATKTIACVVTDEPKRCSDFDWECAHIMDHAACHRGGTTWHPPANGFDGEWLYFAPADGDCPYLSAQREGDAG